ncbi:MAG: T9SS type A sorting domain-containing protein [FCB group bacterium]|jgi:hypothetical protein
MKTKKIFLVLSVLFLFVLNFISLNAQWEECNNGIPYGDINYCTSQGFIVDGNNTYACLDGGVYLTTNNGENWIPKNGELNAFKGQSLFSIAKCGNNIFVGTLNDGIYLSTDKGDNWLHKSNGIPFLQNGPMKYYFDVSGIIVSENNIFAIAFGGLYLSTDNGDNWVIISNALPPIDDTLAIGSLDTLNKGISTMAISGNNIFVDQNKQGIFLTTNYGVNWTAKNNGLINLEIGTFAINGNNIFASTRRGIFLSSDNGDNWKFFAFKDTLIDPIIIKGNYIFGGGLGLFISTNNGNSWTAHNSGLLDLGIGHMIINGDYIFAGTQSGVFRAKLSDLGITDVKENAQNNETLIYPNPASSSVSVKYESSSYSKLQISIFDMLGNEVFSTSEDCNIGMNEKEIDCHSLGTGYYIVRLKQGERVEAKPFLLITN